MLRAIAIFLVILRHTRVYPGGNAVLTAITAFLSRGGWVGVDLFFVLSGFLISGLLFKEFTRFKTISFKRFFVRRGFKIYPPYYAMAFMTLSAVMIHDGNANAFKEAIPWLIYLQDYIYTPIGFIWGHLWSLAIEEQFYLFLPLLLIFLAKAQPLKDNPFKSIPVIFVLIGGFCLVARIFNAEAIRYNGMIHFAPFHVRVDSLFFGVFISYIYHYYPARLRETAKRFRYGLLGMGAALFIPAFLFQLEKTPFIYSIGFTLFYIGGGLILMAVLEDEPNAGLWARALSYAGSRSYSIYLWHFPISWLVYDSPVGQALHFNWFYATAIYWMASVAFGIFVSNLVEIPALSLRDRWYPSRSGRLGARLS